MVARLNAHATNFGGGLLSAFAPTNGRDEVSPTQTPSAPTRSEEAHRVGASRRAILSRDGRTLTRRRPSRREMRACGASSRKRPRRPGVAQAVADGVNSPRGLLQDRHSTPEADQPQYPLPGYYARPTAWRNLLPVRLDWCVRCPVSTSLPCLLYRGRSNLYLPPKTVSCLGS